MLKQKNGNIYWSNKKAAEYFLLPLSFADRMVFLYAVAVRPEVVPVANIY